MGDVHFLQTYGNTHDIAVQTVLLKEIEYQRVSSTRIRGLIGEGKVEEAKELLGHPAVLHGRVVKGDQRGRLLGFPTANLIPPAEKLIPANGVYAARVLVQKASAGSDAIHSPCVFIGAKLNASETPEQWDTYISAINIGVRPTFDGQKLLVEAHLLDVQGLDLYDRCMSIHFIARLRGEQRFTGIEALKAQIAEDVRNVRFSLQKDGQE
jgi:riboflavin kinase/FMN adenylyltransferase